MRWRARHHITFTEVELLLVASVNAGTGACVCAESVVHAFLQQGQNIFC